MKKTTQKLALNRETLRSLEETTLREAIGGGATKIDCTGSCVSTSPTCLC